MAQSWVSCMSNFHARSKQVESEKRKGNTLAIVSNALEMRFSLARCRALATAASSLVDAESSESSSSSSIFTLAADDDMLMPEPANDSERIVASVDTTLASVLKSAFHANAAPHYIQIKYFNFNYI